MTTIDDSQPSGRTWGVAAMPNRTVTPPMFARPSGTTPRHRAGVDRGERTEMIRMPVVEPRVEPPVKPILEPWVESLGEPAVESDGPVGWVGREPPRDHRRARPRYWIGLRTAMVIGALVLGAGGYVLLRQREAAAAFVDLGTVTLTADPMPIGFADPAVVVSVAVAAQDRVAADQELARVRTATNDVFVLRAPSSGAVASVTMGAGGLVRGGEPVVVLYDPERITFQADVPVESLRRLRIGMAARISGPGLDRPVAATLDHVVPVLDARPTGELRVVLLPAPEHRPAVARLLPGLPFVATVDTNSAASAVPAVNAG